MKCKSCGLKKKDDYCCENDISICLDCCNCKDSIEVKGITYKCKECKKVVEFPALPNAETDWAEKLVFGIYSVQAREELCGACRRIKYGKKKK